MSAKPRKPKAEPLDETSEVVIPEVETPKAVIPPCPAMDPSRSMKTPAVVAWWFKYFPEDAVKRYAGLTLD